MARAFALTPLAEADLEAIWAYTARQWSVDQAEVYTNDIFDLFEDIAAGKKAGRPALVREGYFKAFVGKHTIYFRIQGELIVIIRILHQSMDVERHL